MRIEINPGDRLLAFILVFTAVVLAVGIAGAYTANSSSDPTGNQPALMGHSADEVDLRPLHIDATSSRVGIGTGSPGAKLHINDNGGPSPILYIDADDSTPWAIKFNNKAGSGYLQGYLDTAGNFHWNTAVGGYLLTLANSGNVGIGTTSPSQKLDVAGYVKGQTGLCIASDCRSSWPTAGTGDITGVDGGAGLTPNTCSTGDCTLNVNTGSTATTGLEIVSDQIRLMNDGCAANEVLKRNATNTGWQCVADDSGGGSLACVSRSISKNQICDTICSNSGEVCTGSGDSSGVVAIACHSSCPWISCGFCRCCKIQ